MTASVFFGVSSLDLVQLIDLQPQGKYGHCSPFCKSILVLGRGGLKAPTGARSGDSMGLFCGKSHPNPGNL